MQSRGKQMDRSSCVKIYLCSNPEDSVVERRALRDGVFPNLRERCRNTLGLDVRVIDPFESSDPSRWPDENTRQQLIQECRENSAGPFLLALVGHQYGTASLPTQVEVPEYELLLQASQQAGIGTLELERVYQRDENSIPPSYRLRRTHCPQVDVKEEEEIKLRPKEDELRKVFQTTVSLCVHNSLMTPESAQSYYRSALDKDLRFALDNRPDDDIINRCLVYVHKVVNARAERQKDREAVAFHSGTTSTDGQLLSELCDNFLPGLITSSQLLVYTTTTECDRRHGYTSARRRSYAESLCQQLRADLEFLMDRVSVIETSEDAQICGREEAEQEELCRILSRFYEVVRPEEEKVRAYVQQREHQHPLVVTGGPCTGKAVLLAHCAQKIKSWLPDCDPVVVSYFCNLSINPSPKHLLSSLCHQIAGRYHHCGSSFDPAHPDDPIYGTNGPDEDSTSDLDPHSEPTIRDKHTIKPDVCLSELKDRLLSLLSLRPSARQPLFLILDGLDHIKHNFGPQTLGSLPSPLPPSVKVILAVSSARMQILQAISPPSREEEPGYSCVPLGLVDRKQCVKMLASLLSSSGRRVTSGQQVLVNQALTSCCLTLYARLLQLHTSLWHSDSDVSESSLPDGVHSSVSALLDHLEQKHGSSIVGRAVCYLSLSRTGLTEAELADLLSCDNAVLSEYVQRRDESPFLVARVPQIDVETLLLDLRMFLVGRTVAGARVLFWVSRHFTLVVAKRYLGSPEVRREIHLLMVDYFSGRWACGNAKPLHVNQKSPSNPNKMVLYVDRQLSSQPLVFGSSDVGQVNIRKILELPHHLQKSNKLEELENVLLMSPGFHQAMTRAGLLGDLVAMLEGEEESSYSCFPQERALIAGILKSCACFLQSSPRQLPAVMETSLLPYLEAFPALEGFVREIREQRRKRGRGLGVALCPAPSSVPSVQRVKCESKSGDVTAVAGADRGIVAEIMGDGTAWFWRGSGQDVVKLSLSCEQEEELKFAGVKSSGQFMLLSTRCNKLFLWDTTGPEMFLQLPELLKRELKTASRVEGFVARRERLFMSWRGEGFVGVFDVPSEAVTHFQCRSCVTSLVCSSDGRYVFSGQEDGAVSIFDADARCLLSNFSNSNAVTLMILCEVKWEVACVDRAGNVSLWDVAAKTQPPKRVKESPAGDQSKHILSTDYSHEIHTLLVCQSHQVTLWDTCDWELWDQFLAPEGRPFAHAVLSQDGNLFLALLEVCPLVLVWRVSSGECILSLEAHEQPHTLLKTASDVVCVARDGSLAVWDSETIDAAAGAAPKMGRGVKEVAVEQRGERFYTSDGSEAVWRWRLGTGLPHDRFLHDGPVEKLRLSPDNTRLVTLSAGDIYVWQAETGENILRIGGAGATNVLIAPSSNFGVSISEQQLSRVWKLAHGGIVCSIHLHLSDAQVSPEGTFLIGRHRGDLLAASLWSGLISKRFSCVASSEQVVAFRALPQHPDFVVVMAASGAVYTWKVAEETVYRHFHLPYTFHCQPRDFQMSSDGSCALLSTNNEAIKLLDLSLVVLCSFKAEGPVVKAGLDEAGRYIAYISSPRKPCACPLHARPVLTVVRVADGERMGSVCLSKKPLTLVVGGLQCVFVGFEDGSVGVYSISDVLMNEEETFRGRDHFKGQLKECPVDRALIKSLPLATPNITWP